MCYIEVGTDMYSALQSYVKVHLYILDNHAITVFEHMFRSSRIQNSCYVAVLRLILLLEEVHSCSALVRLQLFCQ